jgi:hypothetical protein
MGPSMMKVSKTVSFLIIFVLHWVTQFVAWARADAVRSTHAAHLLWQVLATPLVEVAGSAMDQYFWLVVSLNSLVWATALTWLLTVLARKRR